MNLNTATWKTNMKKPDEAGHNPSHFSPPVMAAFFFFANNPKTLDLTKVKC